MSLSLKARMNSAIFLVLAMLAAMGWLSLEEGRALADKGRWISHSWEVLDSCESLRTHFTVAGTARRTYVADGDPTQIRVFASASTATIAQIAPLRKSVSDDPGQGMRLDELPWSKVVTCWQINSIFTALGRFPFGPLTGRNQVGRRKQRGHLLVSTNASADGRESPSSRATRRFSATPKKRRSAQFSFAGRPSRT